MKILNFANVAGKKRGGGVHEVVFLISNIKISLMILSHLFGFQALKAKKRN